MIDLTAPLRKWLWIGCTIAALCLVFAVLTMCADRDTSRDRHRTEAATTKALDTVAAKTETIRDNQRKQEADVDKIQGSDQRLPDGYGGSLQRVRDR